MQYYYGKKYLFNFLKEHYNLSDILGEYIKNIKMKDFDYGKRRGEEWLKFPSEPISISGIKLAAYSPSSFAKKQGLPNMILVNIKKFDEDTGEWKRLKFSWDKDGLLTCEN